MPTPVQLKTNLGDPIVKGILDELSAICVRHDDDGHVGELMTALLWTVVNATKSFGISPLEILENFKLIYLNVEPAEEVH